MRWSFALACSIVMSSAGPTEACPHDRYFVRLGPFEGCLPPRPSLYVTSLMDPDVTVSAGLDSVPFHVVHIPESGTQRIDVELEYGSIDVTVSVDGGGATIHRYDVSAHCRAEAVVWRVESSNGRSELRWQRPPPLGDTHTIVGLFTDGTESVLYPEPWGEVSWLRTLEPFAVLALFVVCCVLLDLSPRRTCAGRW